MGKHNLIFWKKENPCEDHIKSVEDAYEAQKIAANHLAREEGIAVWATETKRILKGYLAWIVEIKGHTFTGIVLINFNGVVVAVTESTERRCPKCGKVV
jgi:hypothetical protein